MEIIYFILMIIVYITMIIIKKKDEKENLLKHLSIGVVIILCYHTLITFLFNILGIKSTIVNLSIAIGIIEILMIVYIIKTRQIQKYYIKKKDIIFSIIMLVTILLFAYFEFGFFQNIKYHTSDSSTHYVAAKQFQKISDLLSLDNVEINLWGLENLMTGAYVNVGILFKCFASFIEVYDYYIIYEIFDVLILFLSGILFYCLLTSKRKSIKSTIISYIFSILFLIGYPMLVTISGFQYLGIGLIIIQAILLIYPEIRKSKGKRTPYMYITMFLLNFGLFFSYYFFVPIVYGAIILDELMRKGKEILKKDNLIFLIVTVILPTVIGIGYYIIRQMLVTTTAAVNGIGIEGPSEEGQYWNFILFLPFIAYYLYSKLRKKRTDFFAEMFLLTVVLFLILWLGKKVNIVSHYYVCKAYYMFWILSIYMTFKVIEKLIRKKRTLKLITYAFISLYIIFLIITTIMEKPSVLLWQIYNENIRFVLLKDEIINKSEMEIIKHIDDKYKDEIKTFNKSKLGIWGGAILQQEETISKGYEQDDDAMDLLYWNLTRAEGIFINFKRFDDSNPEEDDDEYEVILNNDIAYIVKSTKEN